MIELFIIFVFVGILALIGNYLERKYMKIQVKDIKIPPCDLHKWSGDKCSVCGFVAGT